MNLVLFGPPGSGKGTQAGRLKDRFRLKHVSTGDLLRDAVAGKTELGRKVEGILAAGELVSDEIVLALIREAVSSQAGGGWMMDGFPRTMGQAEALDRLLTAAGQRIDAVIALEVDRDSVIERLSSRRTCPNCKSVYSVLGNPPKKDGVCDKCGGAVAQRKDDQPETIANRMDVYEAQTRPILKYYEGRVPVHRIDGTRAVDEVTAAIKGVLA